MLLFIIIGFYLASERDTLRDNTIENRDVCLFIYVCKYIDPHIFVFASWSTPSNTSTKQNLSV